MPAIGVCRSPFGCSAGNPSSWLRISGEAFSRYQEIPSALTATHSWVRAFARSEPARTPRQFGHPQFHCGKPPPAAEPKTRTCIRRASYFRRSGGRNAARVAPTGARRSDAFVAVVEVFLVRADLGVHFDFDEGGHFPGHRWLLQKVDGTKFGVPRDPQRVKPKIALSARKNCRTSCTM